MGGLLVNVALFLPTKVDGASLAARAQLTLPQLLASKRIERALVFAPFAVPPKTGISWAYYPRHNSPGLDDDILFLQPLADRAITPL